MHREALEQTREHIRALEQRIRSRDAGDEPGRAAAREEVAGLLGSPDPLLRNATAFALKASPDILQEQLAAAGEAVSPTALVGVLLGYYHAGVADDAARTRILNYLDHPLPEVADWAEWVLARVGLPPECGRIGEVVRRPRILSVLARMGPHARPYVPLVAEVARSVPALLAPAVNALSQIGIDADLTMELLGRIPAHDVPIQFDAIRLVANLLGGHRGPADAPLPDEQVEEMVAVVADRLSHEDQWVRYRATLFFCDFRRFVPARAGLLLALLSDANAAVRWRACDALSSARLDASARDTVAGLLRSDPDADLGLAAARLTSSFPEPSVLWRTQIEELLASDALTQRARGVLVAGRVGGDEPCVERLIALAAAPAAELRGWVAWALGRMGGSQDRRYQALAGLCRDACWQVRTTALEALAEHFPPAEPVQAILFAALADPDEQVREIACKLLSRVPPSELKPTPEILSLLDGPLPPLLGPSRVALNNIRRGLGFEARPGQDVGPSPRSPR